MCMAFGSQIGNAPLSPVLRGEGSGVRGELPGSNGPLTLALSP
jgi:hypothetical protein